MADNITKSYRFEQHHLDLLDEYVKRFNLKNQNNGLKHLILNSQYDAVSSDTVTDKTLKLLIALVRSDPKILSKVSDYARDNKDVDLLMILSDDL